MPARPREHELDDIAELAMRKAIPSGWIFRPTDRHDYGVDGSVEIFEDGEATGRLFNVQLKGTDGDDRDNRSAVTVRVDTGAYWNRLPLPTLLVRHHAGSDHLYARWWHDHTFRPADGQKTMTFRFESEHRWTEATAATLSCGVEAFHRVRSAHLQLPLPTTLIVDPALTDGRPPGVIRTAVRSAADRLPRLVTLETDGLLASDVVVVAISQESIEVRLGGGVTAELPSIARNVACVGFDVLLAIALALSRIGLASAASSIIDVGLPESSHSDSADILAQVGRTYLAAHRVEAGISLAENLLDEGADPLAIFSLMRELISTTGAHSEADERALSAGLAACATRLQDDQVAAFALRLAADSVRRAQPDLSLTYLRSAADRVPGLAGEPEWLEEFAGALVDSERAEEAVPLYRHLIAGQPDALHLHACLADSLLIAGRIDEAAKTFNTYRSQGGADRRWVASERVALELVRQGVGNWEAAVAVFELNVVADDPDHPLPYGCRVALAWFNAGVAADQAGRREDALLMYLAAVVLFVVDDEAWVQATTHALQSGDLMLFASIAEAAYRQRGYAFLDCLRRMITDQFDANMAAEFLDMLDIVFAGQAFLK